MVAAATIGGSVLSAGASMIGSSSAADAQMSAADSASRVQMEMFNKIQQNLKPYMDYGGNAWKRLNEQAGTGSNNPLGSALLQAPSMNFNQSMLEATPGYKFNLEQGLKGVQNAAAARGLGSSGAALKGAAGFATGLADSTYQNQFNNAVTNQTNQFNRLLSLANVGQSSAAGVGDAGMQTAANIGANTIGAGNAAAGSYMNMARSVGNAGSSISNLYMTNSLMKNMTGQGLF